MPDQNPSPEPSPGAAQSPIDELKVLLSEAPAVIADAVKLINDLRDVAGKVRELVQAIQGLKTIL
jgi:hypothetical protein